MRLCFKLIPILFEVNKACLKTHLKIKASILTKANVFETFQTDRILTVMIQDVSPDAHPVFGVLLIICGEGFYGKAPWDSLSPVAIPLKSSHSLQGNERVKVYTQ